MTDKNLQYQATQIVRKAIDDMLTMDPFFGHLMDQLRLEPDSKKDVKTISTNGRILCYDSQWVVEKHRKEGDSRFATILAHEATHIAFGHPYRQGDKDAETYEKAADAVTNDILQSRGYTLPSGSFCLPGARNYTVEEVYRQIKQAGGRCQDERGAGRSQPQQFGGFFSPEEGTDAEEEAKARGETGESAGESDQDSEDEVRENVARAAQRARKAGNMPGQYEKMIQQSLLSKKDWREHLKLFLGGGEIKMPSWSRPNRRFLHQDMYLPGAAKHGPGRVVLAVDVSGSIDASLLEKFLAEVRKINIDLQPDAIDVMTCDTRIPWQQEFGPYDDVEVPKRAITGGGTAFSPVFRRVDEMGVEPKALVYFTDLECSDFGPKPDYPVMWVVWPGGRDRAPWGDIIKMED